MKFHLACSMCGKEREFEVTMEGYNPADVLNRSLISNLRDATDGTSWQFQVNGMNIDAYCSKKCAA